jgi:hypothetical protein
LERDFTDVVQEESVAVCYFVPASFMRNQAAPHWDTAFLKDTALPQIRYNLQQKRRRVIQ